MELNVSNLNISEESQLKVENFISALKELPQSLHTTYRSTESQQSVNVSSLLKDQLESHFELGE